MADWDDRYLGLAGTISEWSKDPSTKIGAVIVGDRGQILSQGYNGFPRGMDDDDRLNDRDQKYPRIVHAELNAIYNACLNGVSLRGSTMYVVGLPVCSECAKGIIQVGIKRVVMRKLECTPEKWADSYKTTSAMFEECGVAHEIIP